MENINNCKLENFDFSEQALKIALVGNPNTGKSTLFNRLTGSAQYVGNWPGVTVERKEGRIKSCKIPMDIVDLPGIYSLSPYSPEEIVTRNFLLSNSKDIILNIIDGTHLERNLYLTTQLMELDAPIIIAINMCDLLKKKGKIINFCELEQKLGVPVIMISASKNIGLDNIKEKFLNFCINKQNIKEFNNKNIKFYNNNIESKFLKISTIFDSSTRSIENKRFFIAKILENDLLINSHLKLNFETLKKINEIKKINTSKELKNDEIINLRYQFIFNLCKKIVQDTQKLKKITFTRKIDSIIIGKYTAIPIFLTIIFGVFYITFGPIGTFLEKYLRILINQGIGQISETVFTQIHMNSAFKSLILGAIIPGVGEIISFLPPIMLLFALISLLEDVGYMSRAAFIMDRSLKNIGLSGRAFIPLLMGFGCSVPAITSTRILENRQEKNLSIFLIPFMSCGSKMPVNLLFLSGFFPKYKALGIFLIYLLGAIFCAISAWLFKSTIFKSKPTPLILELPEYKIPSLRNMYVQVWDRLRDFLERAGTVILAFTVVIWFLQSFDIYLNYTLDSSKSILVFLGNLLAPLFIPCGFGYWRPCVALLTGLISKEMVVSTMAVLYKSNSLEPLKDLLAQDFNAISAISFLIFVLFYPPCMAAIANSYKELRSKKLALISIFYQIFLAWFISSIFFQIFSRIF
ncbi:MAG: ferrous iron transport protein B [Candidatus Improbicoccus devescovinae]|nr:MAG: ferrous iron transport protein B [Candidatus Improbicoccus devescovinae]